MKLLLTRAVEQDRSCGLKATEGPVLMLQPRLYSLVLLGTLVSMLARSSSLRNNKKHGCYMHLVQ